VSVFHGAAEDYLALRRAGGYQLLGHDKLLADFADYLEQAEVAAVTTAVCLAWAAGEEAATRIAIAKRLSVVRRFCRYLRSLDDRTEVPPVNLVAPQVGRVTPYLYSKTEIVALMDAAGRLRPPLRAATYRTLIGLMASTGIRRGEAAGLRRDDVDLADDVLLVHYAKGGKSRLVPIHPSTTDALGSYAECRDRLCPGAKAPTFFVSGPGRPLNASVSYVFRQLADEAGISAAPGRRPPRLHDLRHTFAVATLLRWYDDGEDVVARVPILSTYLGHLGPKETYWYLEATPELMAAAVRRLEAFLGDEP